LPGLPSSSLHLVPVEALPGWPSSSLDLVPVEALPDLTMPSLHVVLAGPLPGLTVKVDDAPKSRGKKNASAGLGVAAAAASVAAANTAAALRVGDRRMGTSIRDGFNPAIVEHSLAYPRMM
jgi:hypothetical protein